MLWSRGSFCEAHVANAAGHEDARSQLCVTESVQYDSIGTKVDIGHMDTYGESGRILITM